MPPCASRVHAVRALLLASAAIAAEAADGKADAIYFDGDILTMAGKDPSYAEALAVADGKIVFVGAKEDALKLKGDATRLVDLHGHTLLPGFIDGHGHMIYYGKNMIDADLVGVTSIPELIARMKAQAAKMGPDDWIVGFGYSVLLLKENRHPTAAELNEISPDRPIMVVDNSGHNGAGNSGIFKILGLDAGTRDPEGGSLCPQPGRLARRPPGGDRPLRGARAAPVLHRQARRRGGDQRRASCGRAMARPRRRNAAWASARTTSTSSATPSTRSFCRSTSISAPRTCRRRSTTCWPPPYAVSSDYERQQSEGAAT